MNPVNLSKFVPFELVIDSKENLISKAGKQKPTYSTRKLLDMKEVIYDTDWLNAQQENVDLYYMYRDLTRAEDKERFSEHKIRFDVTIIPPRFLGKEYVKTAGHFHPEAEQNISYPEVYEVMHGEGLYVLQSATRKKNGSLDIIILSAKAGEQVLIPPGYGHITINPRTDTTLVMNNLVSSAFSSIYEPIKNNNGAAYLYLRDKSWIQNPKYTSELLVRKLKPKQLTKKPFYYAFLEEPNFWKFLNEPSERKEWL